MNLRRLLSSIGRRWYIAVAGLLVTAVLCGFAYQAIKPTYERLATVTLLPGTATIPVGGNPYLYLGGLTQASDVLVTALGASSVQSPIIHDFPGSTINVARDQSTSGPMLLLTVDARSDANAAGALDEILAEVPATLATLQERAHVPGGARMDSLTLTSASTSTVSQKTRYELVAIAGVLGLAVTLLFVALIDSLLLTRADRVAVRRSSQAAGKAPGDTTEDSDVKTERKVRKPRRDPQVVLVSSDGSGSRLDP
jgi:hypothetical protein